MKINELDLTTRSYILESKLRQAANAYNSTQHADSITLECIYCGEKRQKGTLYKANTGRWCYICWKMSCPCAGKAISAEKWLKTANSALYQSYIDELKRECTEADAKNYQVEAEKAKEQAELKHKAEVEERIKEDNESAKAFKHISIPGIWQKKALAFCKKRKIPSEYAKTFFYADTGKYRGRVIIPFKNARNELIFWQGRALYDTDVKYLSRVGNTALYNIDFKDKTKPLIITEGPIDSMFLENGTATVGASSSAALDGELKNFKRYWLYDNDEAGQKAAGQRVMEHEYVFLWKKFLQEWNITGKVKDINDVVLYLNKSDKFKFKELESYFTNVRDIFLMYA